MTCRTAAAALWCAAAAVPLEAQLRVEPRGPAFWTALAVTLAAAAANDAALSHDVRNDRTTLVGRLADELEPLGRERVAVPLFSGAWLAARATGRESAARAVVRIAAGYAVADLVTTLLKHATGRYRPDTAGAGPWRSSPFRRDAQWHSFPSGHAAHVFAIAAGLSAEHGQPVAGIAAYGVAALVAWQRVISGSHWPSDVVAGAAIGIVGARSVGGWMRRARERESHGRAAVYFSSRAIAVAIALRPALATAR